MKLPIPKQYKEPEPLEKDDLKVNFDRLFNKQLTQELTDPEAKEFQDLSVQLLQKITKRYGSFLSERREFLSERTKERLKLKETIAEINAALEDPDPPE